MPRYISGKWIKQIVFLNDYEIEIELKDNKKIRIIASFYPEIYKCIEYPSDICFNENVKLDIEEFEEE